MPNSPAASDEVDILQLLVNTYRFLLKNWLIVIVSLLMCGIGTWIIYLRADRIYESRMVVNSQFLTEAYASPVVKNLMALVLEGDSDGLSTKLSVTPTEAASLKSIVIESPTGDRMNLLEEDRKIFVIVVETKDPAILPKLQAGLVHYFEGVEFVKSRVEEKRKVYTAVIDRIKHEIALVDQSGESKTTLRPFPTMSTGENPKSTEAAIFDPSTMVVYMQTQLSETEEKLATLNGLEVIDGFTPSKYELRPKKTVYIASAISSGILLAVLLLFLRSFQQVLKKYPK